MDDDRTMTIIYVYDQDATLNSASPVLRLARAGETAWGALPGDHWTVFRANSSTYEPVAWALRQDEYGFQGICHFIISILFVILKGSFCKIRQC